MDPDTQKHHDIVSLDFLVIHFFLFLQCLSYHISKCAQIMLTPLRHCQQLSLSCLSFFLHFLAIFTSVTILGIHQYCWQWPMSCYSILSWCCPDVLGIFASIIIFGNAHRPYKQYPTIVNNSLHHVYFFLLSFPDFLVIFLWITILGNMYRPCKQYTNVVDNDLHLSLHFFLIFPDFLTIFALITILENAHRPCKLYLNIINKYTSCLSVFSWLFPHFLIIFVLITILGSAHRPCKQHPCIITTIPIFFWFYYYFSCENAKLSIIGIF